MEVPLSILLLLCLFFFLAGFVDSIAGGGGLITIPAMLVCGIPPHMALGTTKFASALGMLSSLWTFARSRLIVTSIAPLGFATSFLGAVGGSSLTMLIDSAFLGKLLIFLLPVGMILSLFSRRSPACEENLPPRFLKLKVFLLCLTIGMYAGFFGPGTGSFFILAQNIVLRMGLVRAAATTKVFNLAANTGALTTFATGGVVMWSLGLPLAIASILGNQAGVRLAIRV
ncbi:MAG: TSUP family transporter, partial [Mailhella sp.]|nr:TSUP family transporter [Mailhella sp.]